MGMVGVSEKDRAHRVLNILFQEFGKVEVTRRDLEPFEALVATVLSQHTNDLNSGRAFKNLSVRFRVTPETIALADEEELGEAIKVAGFYRNKARMLKRLAQTLVQEFKGSLNSLFTLPLDEARQRLMRLPGVGPKTADVLLLFSMHMPTFPIDTHIWRVSKRTGFASQKAGYEETRRTLQILYSPALYMEAHLLLIRLGRSYCKARKPRCFTCPVRFECPKLYT